MIGKIALLIILVYIALMSIFCGMYYPELVSTHSKKTKAISLFIGTGIACVFIYMALHILVYWIE